MSTGKNHCEGKPGRREKKAQRLSSQNRAEADERKQSKGKDRKRKQKVSTSGTAVGAKLGRTKGNEQKAKYQ